MNPKIYASATILAIVLVSGCTLPFELPFGLGAPGPTPGIAGLGLEMTSFTAEPSTIFSRSTVRIIVETENKGGTSVPDSESLIYLTGSNLDLTDTSGLSWHNSEETQYKHFGKEMRAADVVRGIPADVKRFTWTLTAPNLTAGQTRTDTFYGRVYHDYKTSANGNVWVYTETEAEAARTAGRALNKASFTYTTGPVGVVVTVTPDPVILYTGENTFTLYINVKNLATGTIYKKGGVTYTSGSEDISLASDELNKVDVSITAPSGLDIKTGCTGEQELVAGRETTLVCDVEVKESIGTFKSFAISVTTNYGYFTEKTASVTVQGR